jgi:predicted nucleotidyltransferase
MVINAIIARVRIILGGTIMVASLDQEVVLQQVVAAMADLPGIATIALGGSTAAGLADADSDFDVYIYYRQPLAAPADRAARLRPLADVGTLEVDIPTFGLEDHLHMRAKLIELVYLDLDRLSADARQAYGQGLSSEGYTTALLYILACSPLLHDLTGEVTALQAQLQAGYPEPTRARLLRENPELLRYFLELLRISQRRGDLLYVQHMRYSLQMVFFNLLFALNRLYHPGGKRLLRHAQRCGIQPAHLPERWNDIARLSVDDSALADRLEQLIDDLCRLIEAES